MERLTLQELAKYLDHVIEIDYDFKAETDFAKKIWCGMLCGCGEQCC